MPDRGADARQGSGSDLVVGYKNPPLHSRFKKGVSGNPAGPPKRRKNLRGLVRQILNEQISVREGQTVRKVSKAEAALRGMVVGALRGDAGSLAMLLRMAEQTGEFQPDDSEALVIKIQRFGTADTTDA